MVRLQVRQITNRRANMRSLKITQYNHRFKQFQETFESTLPEGSFYEYQIELRNAFKKSLTADGITMPIWIIGQPHPLTVRHYEY